MKNTSYKKSYRVKVHGNAQPWGQWSEVISSVKVENRRCRKAGKVICQKAI